MGASLIRVIEVKRNNKWEILPFPTINNTYYDSDIDDFAPSKELGNNMYLSYYTEASLNLRDNVFGYRCDNILKNSSLPQDMCDDVKKVINDRHTVYCITLKELSAYISKKDAEFEKEVENFYNKKFSNLINLKLDCLLKGKDYKEFEKQKSKKIKNNEILDDEEDLEYAREYIWKELYYTICSLNSEYTYINDILYNMFNDWPDCRIYYFLD